MSDKSTEETLEALLKEDREFPPDPQFAQAANGKAELYEQAAADREAFWGKQARELISWSTDFDQVLDWSQAPVAKWFVGGKLNASYNALDRHVEAGKGDKVAFHFVSESGTENKDWTYAEVLAQVKRAANALKALGVGTGDRVAIYMPMIPEAAIAMLACARIGAPHTVVFGGYSADAIRSRVADAEAKVVITADGQFRRGKPAALKPTVDEATGEGSTVEHVLVVKRTGQDVAWKEGRDIWWHEALEQADGECEPVQVDSEHPLYILYTSGTTGKPKGVFHTTGGYLVQSAYTCKMVHDLKDDDVYWCTADIGWVTGHTYVVYGPMSLGVTQVMYEGTPDSPHQGRWWEIIQDQKVSVLYTAPTAIRTFMKWGSDIPRKYDLSSLRLLGSVGEPINPEAWIWYREIIGSGRTPVVDTWWQTETGAIMVSALPGVTALKPGSAQAAIPGISVDVVDEQGNSVGNGHGGYLIIDKPWPAMLRGVWGDMQRYQDTYWSRFDGVYFAGDGAKRDDDGNIWVLGRVDDVMNVSGHRLSTTEIESALVSHPKVAEAAVVGASDVTTGQAVVAFVILRGDAVAEADEPGEGKDLVADLRNHVSKVISPIAKPRSIMIVPELPKTRSGKIMRRLLRDVAEHRDIGDVTTLADSSVMDQIKQGMDEPSSAEAPAQA